MTDRANPQRPGLQWKCEEESKELGAELAAWRCFRGAGLGRESMAVVAHPGGVSVEGRLVMNDAEAETFVNVVDIALRRSRVYRHNAERIRKGKTS